MPHIRSQETVDSALRMSDNGVSDKTNAEIHSNDGRGPPVEEAKRCTEEVEEEAEQPEDDHLPAL